MGEVISSMIARDIQKATGLSAQDFAILSQLRSTRNGVRKQRDIQQFLGWDKSRLSHQLSRMASREVITRENRPEQGLVVCITEEGIKQIIQAEPIHSAAVRRYFLDFLNPDDMNALTSIAAKLREGLESQATYDDFQ
ncbi:marR-family regulatory protein [Escherichia fergusonii]|nr:marR-family regulatory protein [Escherichia fergusonii]